MRRAPKRVAHPYNLQLDRPTLQLNGSNLEINADGADKRLGVGVIGEA